MSAVRVGNRRWLNGRMAAPTAGASSDKAARATGAIAGTLPDMGFEPLVEAGRELIDDAGGQAAADQHGLGIHQAVDGEHGVDERVDRGFDPGVDDGLAGCRRGR